MEGVVTFCAYDWPGNICGPMTWLTQLVSNLERSGVRSRCLLMYWGDSGPLSELLRMHSVDYVQTCCQGTTESRIRWILDELSRDLPSVFVPNLVTPALFAARWVREACVPTVGVLHSDDNFYRGVRDEFIFGSPDFALSHVVCVSREIYNQTVGLKPELTEVTRIPYGVSVPEKPVHRVPKRLRVAYVGRLADEQKRISEVTEALIRVTLEIPDVEAEIIGDGIDRQKVETILAAAGRPVPVNLVGRLSPGEVQSRLLSIDVIVLLSDYEGLPIALLEAMACGVVPVCLDMRSGIPELVRHQETGIIVRDRGDDFVAAVRTLRDDEQLWEKLSTAARNLIVAEYSHESSTRQWAKLIHSLAEKRTQLSQIQVPKQFDLPPVNPALAAEDYRGPVSPPLGLGQRAIQLAGRLKRSVLRSRDRK